MIMTENNLKNKTFVAPSIEEIDFKETSAPCGTGYLEVLDLSSGQPVLRNTGKCINVFSWLNLDNFDDTYND